MTYKNLLFDLDGTLTDSSEGIIKSVKYAYEKLGIECPAEKLLPTFIGPPLGDSFVRCGVPEEKRDLAVDTFRERYNVVGKFENAPYPGMIDLLARLQKEGYHLYVATSKPEKTALEVLDHFDMTKYFDEVAGATMDSSREKKEDVIRYLKEKIQAAEENDDINSADEHMENACNGTASCRTSDTSFSVLKADEKVTAHKTAMIGDTSFDVLGAAEFDIPTIGVTWGFGDIEQMKKDGAICIVSTMDELYKIVAGI